MSNQTAQEISAGRRTILAIFFLQALASGGVFPRIPDIQEGLGLSETSLGLMLMAPALGGLVSILIASRLLERFGTKALLMVAIPGTALATTILAATGLQLVGYVALFFFGVSFSFSNVAMNVEADRVEAATGTRIMNRCHGLWGIGMLVAALIGAGARGIPITAFAQFAFSLPVIALLIFVLVGGMKPAPPRPHSGSVKRRIFVRPTRATLALAGFGVLASLTEGAVRNWSVIFMRDSFVAPEWIDTLTLPAFLATLSLGRMFGDRWVDRFGALLAARVLVVVAFVGLGVVVAAPTLPVALVGFALMGIGICVVFPLTISAAASLGDAPASENVAAFTLINASVMMIAPGIIGIIADGFNIRVAFAALTPVFILNLWLASRVLKK